MTLRATVRPVVGRRMLAAPVAWRRSAIASTALSRRTFSTTAPSKHERNTQSFNVLEHIHSLAPFSCRTLFAHAPSPRRDDDEEHTATARQSRPLIGAAALPVALATSVASTDAAAAVPWYAQHTATAPWDQILSLAPLGFFFGLQLSPWKTIQDIRKAGHTSQYSPLPYVMLGTNCFLWTVYGYLAQDVTVMAANGMGAALSAYYTAMFHQNTSMSMSKFYAGSLAFGALTTAVTLLSPMETLTSLGVLGNLIAIGFFASPLGVMKTVIEEKSTASMPFAVSLASLGNCMAWSAYGYFVAHDIFVLAPNLIGILLSTAQLSLFARFGIQTPGDKKSTDA